MAASEHSKESTQVYLPDFCSAGVLLIIVLVAELIAIALTLASYGPDERFLIELSKICVPAQAQRFGDRRR